MRKRTETSSQTQSRKSKSTGEKKTKVRNLKPSPEYIENTFQLLQKEYGEVHCPLNYTQPHELAIAVILSAQCTDEQVNRTTPDLFRAYPTLESFAHAKLPDVEKLIYSTGFYKNKAKNVTGFAKQLLENHNGEMPRTLEELTKLPGIGRKTANVVLQELFSIPSGVVVDTHVARLSKVLGITNEKDPAKIERALQEIIPKEYWMDWSLYMIFLGRSYCTAKKRNCKACILNQICVSSEVE